MGLDDFTSDTNTQPSSTTQTHSGTEEKQEEEEFDPFKVVSGNRGRKKVFPTEEDWEKTVDFVESQLGFTIDEVMKKSAAERYQILHQAILEIDGSENIPFHPTKECIVCGKVFTFPNTWNFTRIKGEPVCNDHEIGVVMEEISSVNAIKG